MRINGFVVHGAVTAAVFASGVGAVVAGGASGGVTLAGPQVLRLIQHAPSALSSVSRREHVVQDLDERTGSALLVDDAWPHQSGRQGRNVATGLQNGLGTLTFEAVNKTMYVHASPRSAASLGKHWVGMTLTNPSSGWAPNQPSVGTDGLGFVHLMPGATGDVQDLGTARIGGVRTTNYRVTIDMQKAAAAESPSYELARSSELQAAGITTEPVDVWLDHEGAPRQMSFTFDVQSVHAEFQLRLGRVRPIRCR